MKHTTIAEVSKAGTAAGSSNEWNSLQVLQLAVKDILRSNPNGLLALAIQGLLPKPVPADLLKKLLGLMSSFGEITCSPAGIYSMPDTDPVVISMRAYKARRQRRRPVGQCPDGIMNVLATGPMTCPSIAEVLGLERKEIYTFLSMLMNDGLVRVSGKCGRYKFYELIPQESNFTFTMAAASDAKESAHV